MQDLELFKDAVGVYQYEPGTKVTKPGVYLDMPMSVYHGQPTVEPSISSSQLRKIFNHSLADYWLQSPLNPERQPFVDTEFTILGRAAHHILLGEAEFSKHFVIRPEDAPNDPEGRKWNANNKYCKQWLGEQQLRQLTVLTEDQVERIRQMEAALLREPPIAVGGILNGAIEASMFYRDEETGIWIKSRPDSIPNDADVADLKCVSDVTDEGISRSLGDQGYHQQAATTKSAMAAIFRRVMENFFLVYAQSAAPFSVRIDTIDPEDIHAGELENRAALHLFARALETNYWPGPKNLAGDGGIVSRTKFAREKAARRRERIEKELGLSHG